MKILFQGDSITDAGRSFDPESDFLGYGYPKFVAETLEAENPGSYTFVNRGIGGNRIVDLYERRQADILDIKPDFMSILIGVNDVWHRFINDTGIELEVFDDLYPKMLKEIKERMPDTKLLILGPYVLKGSGNDYDLEDGRYFYPIFRSEIEKRAASAKRIAEEFGLPYLSLMDLLDETTAKDPDVAYLADGVHPTERGHRLIAEAWIKEFKKIVG